MGFKNLFIKYRIWVSDVRGLGRALAPKVLGAKMQPKSRCCVTLIYRLGPTSRSSLRRTCP